MKKALIVASLLLSLEMRAQKLIPYDKLLHFSVGFYIGNATGLVVNNPTKRLVYATGLGMLAGSIKEIRDYNTYGRADYRDVLATTAGSVAGALLITGIENMFKRRHYGKSSSHRHKH